MRSLPGGRPTQQQKLIETANKFGLNQLKNQQGSTVIIYDTLPLNGQTQLRFFENAAQRNFPLSNMGPDGNKLGVGYGMIFERCYLTVCEYDTEKNIITSFSPVEIGGGATDTTVLNGEMTINIANSDVLKKIPLLSFMPEFNNNALNSQLSCYTFETMISLQQLLEFVVTLRLPNYTPDEKLFYLRLTIEGAGAIIAPRTTF